MRFTYLPHTLLTILTLLAAWGLVRDGINTHKGGAIDLRNRLTGTRIAQADKDPFLYKWEQGEPAVFCDPFNLKTWPLSKTTVTPVALAVNLPYSGLNYKPIQWLWFLIQYGVLALGCLAWCQGSSRSNLFWGLGWTLLFCCSAAWRLHVDRGQIYVVYAGLLLLLVALSRHSTWWKSLIEGTAGGLLMGLRPTFISHFAVPAAERRWLATGTSLATLAAMVGLPMLLFGGDIWTQYKSAMDEHARLYLEQVPPTSAPMSFPANVENMPFDELAGFARTIPFADTSIHKLTSFAFSNGVTKSILAMWALLMFCSGIYLMCKHPNNTNLLWWAITAWLLLGDYLLPAYRNIYNDALAWPMLLMGLTALRDRPRLIWIGLGTTLLLLQIAVWQMPKGFIGIPSYGALILASATIVWTFKVQNGSVVESPSTDS